MIMTQLHPFTLKDPKDRKYCFAEDYWLEAVELDEVQDVLGIDFTDGD